MMIKKTLKTNKELQNLKSKKKKTEHEIYLSDMLQIFRPLNKFQKFNDEK